MASVSLLPARALRVLAHAALAGACALATHAARAQEPSVLTVPRLAQFSSLDPVRGYDQTVEQVARQVYSTLMTYAYLERPYKLEPDLLEAMPTVSADKLTWTFKLRKVDATTFTIKLTHENSLFLHALTLLPTAVVPREAVRFYKDRFQVNPVGTGPFMATQELTRNGTIRLVRNPAYYRTYPRVGAPGDAAKGLLKDAGKKLPMADVLEMPLIEEPQPAALKFLRGELDWRPLDRTWFTRMAARNADGTFRLADEYAGKFAVYGAPSMEVEYLLVNLRDPVLGKNKLLRQALAAAVDPQAVIDVLWNGRGRKLQSIVPYDLPGSERETGAVARAHDVAAARKLLAQAGFPEGKGLEPLTISFFETNTTTHNEFDLLKSQFAAIGVKVKGVFMDQPTFTKAAENGNFQIGSYGWVADYPDAEDFYQLNYGRNVPPGGNWSGYANPAYDKAYEASRFMANGPERLAHFRAMNALIQDDVPMILVFSPLKVGVTQNWIGGFKRNLLLQEHMYLSVDMARKKKGP